MGSGKTTIFKRVMKNSPKISGFDLDELVQKEISNPGENLGQAIERVGFKAFREVEKSLLFQKLRLEGSCLISLGGGSLSPEVLKYVEESKNIKLIWLKTDFETCWERISSSDDRPLVKKGKEALESLFTEREDQYRSANMVLDMLDQTRIMTFEELDDGC